MGAALGWQEWRSQGPARPPSQAPWALGKAGDEGPILLPGFAAWITGPGQRLYQPQPSLRLSPACTQGLYVRQPCSPQTESLSC